MTLDGFQILIGDPKAKLRELPIGVAAMAISAPPETMTTIEILSVLEGVRMALEEEGVLWLKLRSEKLARDIETAGWLLLDSRPTKGLYLFSISSWVEWESDILNELPEPPSGSPEAFPMKWADILIEACTKEDQVVLDPFATTGALGAMAVYRGRKAIQVVSSAELETKARVRAEKAFVMRQGELASPKARPPVEAALKKKRWQLLQGDCLEVLKTLPAESVDAVVTDPPYGLSKDPDILLVLEHWLRGDSYEHDAKGFMAKSWDSFVPGPEYWREIFRVLKPGAHLLAMGGTRTIDLLTVAVRIAGFEIRDSIASYQGSGIANWVYAAGFPKSQNVGAAIDKTVGAERETVGYSRAGTSSLERVRRVELGYRDRLTNVTPSALPVTIASSEAAKQWDGWGTALRPSHEPILVARKPLSEPTVAAQVLKTGTGAINIDACRTETEPRDPGNVTHTEISGKYGTFGVDSRTDRQVNYRLNKPEGRWPANAVFSHSVSCIRVGTKSVKTGLAYEPESKQMERSIYGKTNTLGRVCGYASQDGTEEVESWNCVEACPIRLLNEQGGIRKSGTGAVKRQSAAGSQGNAYGKESRPEGTEIPTYGDEGVVSRYFPTFAWSEEDTAPFLFTAKAPRSERDSGLVEKGDTGVRANTHPT